MRRPKYCARPGAPINDEQANLVGYEMEYMERDGIDVTPDAFLERSAEASHPCHVLFPWDDKKAAHQHRLDLARRFMGSVQIIEVKTRPPTRARYSVRVQKESSSKREYVTKRKVVKSDDYMSQMSEQLYVRIRAAVRTAEDLGLNDKWWARLTTAFNAGLPDGVFPDEEEAA